MPEARSLSVKSGITALAGGANSAATPVLDGDVNVLGTVATAADSAKLPASVPAGGSLVVANGGAASANVFPPTGGTINGGAGAVAVANGKAALFYQVGSGANTGLTWVSVAGA